MKKVLMIRKKGVDSIAFGVFVLIMMISASFIVRDEEPKKINFNYVFQPPSINILRYLTDVSALKSIFAREEDSESLKIYDEESLEQRNGQKEAPQNGSYNEEILEGTVNKREKSEIIESYIFGSDENGRNIFLMLAAASDTYLIPCFLAVVIALLLGVFFGVLSGYFVNKWPSTIGNFFLDAIRSIPLFVGIIIIVCATSISIYTLMITFGILVAPRIGTVVEQQILLLRQHDFIVAAVEMGVPTSSIIFKHILYYNCSSLLISQAAFTYTEAVLMETTISFLTRGALGADISWGAMVEIGLSGFMDGKLWCSLFPTLAIVVTILAFQALGNGFIKFFDYRSQVSF